MLAAAWGRNRAFALFHCFLPHTAGTTEGMVKETIKRELSQGAKTPIFLEKSANYT